MTPLREKAAGCNQPGHKKGLYAHCFEEERADFTDGEADGRVDDKFDGEVDVIGRLLGKDDLNPTGSNKSQPKKLTFVPGMILNRIREVYLFVGWCSPMDLHISE